MVGGWPVESLYSSMSELLSGLLGNMLQRTPIFPNVIELNHQARRRITCSAYLIYDESEWTLFDIGYEDAVDDCVELIRQLDFPFSKCKTLIASHADVDHIQDLPKPNRFSKHRSPVILWQQYTWRRATNSQRLPKSQLKISISTCHPLRWSTRSMTATSFVWVIWN